MATALDIIEGAMQDLGILIRGQLATSTQAADGLEILNLMLESWKNERLMAPWIVTETFNLTSGDGSYTIGTGANFSTGRPIKILPGTYATVDGIDYPLTIIEAVQYNAIGDKTTQGTYPEVLYYSPEWNFGVINLWPLPGAGVTLSLMSWKQVATFSTSTTAVSAAPGYELSYRHNLALLMAPGYGVTPNPYLVESAKKTKFILKRVNTPAGVLQMPHGLVNYSGGPNIYTDGL